MAKVVIRFFDDETLEGVARDLDFDEPDFLVEVDDAGGLENNETAWIPLTAVKRGEPPRDKDLASETPTRKVAIRFLDGEVLRGHLDGSLERHRYGVVLNLHAEQSDSPVRKLGIPFSAVKALFFIREFDARGEEAGTASDAYLAHLLKGGVIMDVVTAEHARIAQDAGAAAVMALERVPADIRKHGGVARMSDPDLIKSIMQAVTIPVMAKCRIGHFVEAQILEALGVDYIDESEVLTPTDEEHHIDKHPFKLPFVCGCRDLGEATRRIAEGAAMIRTKGEAGTGNVVEAVRHAPAVNAGIRKLHGMNRAELVHDATDLGAPVEVLIECQKLGRLPVVNFAAGGIATPADAALMMQLGVDGVFVGSGIFKSEDPLKRAKAIVAATTYYDKPEMLAEVSAGLGEAMHGLEIPTIPKDELLAAGGW